MCLAKPNTSVLEGVANQVVRRKIGFLNKYGLTHMRVCFFLRRSVAGSNPLLARGIGNAE